MGFLRKLFGKGGLQEAPRRPGASAELQAMPADPVERHIQEGLQHAAQRNLEAAAECFRQALELSPGHSIALLNLGATYVDRGRIEGEVRNRPDIARAHARNAVLCLVQAIRAKPALPPHPRGMALLSLGRMYNVLDEWNDATATLFQVVDDPEIPREFKDTARELLANVHARSRFPARNFTDEQVRAHRALRTQVNQLTAGLLTTEDGSLPGPPAPEERRRLEDALPLLDQSLQIAPEDWPSMWIAGKIHQRLGNAERALEWYARAHDVNPYNPNVGREAGICASALGMAESALAFAESAFRADPDDPGLLSNLAIALFLSGQLDAARERVAEAVRRDPKDPVSRGLREMLDKVASGEMTEDALRELIRTGR